MVEVELKYISINEIKSHFDELFDYVSQIRKDKVNKLIKESDKYLSLGAGYLIKKYIGDNIKYNVNGKPYTDNIYFNISHSGEYIVLAISNVEVGIDIERVSNKDVSNIVKSFSLEEQKFIKSEKDFYLIWTNKESLIKCIGETIGVFNKISSLPINGIKEYKGHKYNSKSFEIDNHTISLTINSEDDFKINMKNIKIDV